MLHQKYELCHWYLTSSDCNRNWELLSPTISPITNNGLAMISSQSCRISWRFYPHLSALPRILRVTLETEENYSSFIIINTIFSQYNYFLACNDVYSSSINFLFLHIDIIKCTIFRLQKKNDLRLIIHIKISPWGRP